MFAPAEFNPTLYHVASRPVTVRRSGKRLLFRVFEDLATQCGIYTGGYAHVMVEKDNGGQLTGRFRLLGNQNHSSRKWTVNTSATRHPIFSCQFSGELAVILAALPPQDSQNLTIHDTHPKNGITVSYAPTKQ
jgi:muconolactone delta-isomerase